jgi:hypothetical protein
VLTKAVPIKPQNRNHLPKLLNVEFALRSDRELIWSHKWKYLLFETEAASTTGSRISKAKDVTQSSRKISHKSEIKSLEETDVLSIRSQETINVIRS